MLTLRGHIVYVYTLLGMCSDDLSAAVLKPNYILPWNELMYRVVNFILGDHVSVETWKEKKIAVIKSKGTRIFFNLVCKCWRQ
jgi:hypothetical protein